MPYDERNREWYSNEPPNFGDQEPSQEDLIRERREAIQRGLGTLPKYGFGAGGGRDLDNFVRQRRS